MPDPFKIHVHDPLPESDCRQLHPPLDWLNDWRQLIFRLPQGHLLEIHILLAEIFAQNQPAELARRCLAARQTRKAYLAPKRFTRFLHLALSQVRHSGFNLNQFP